LPSSAQPNITSSKTQYGTSEEWFGNAISEVFGVLQGSGAAPAVWLAASIVLIRAYNKLFSTNGIPNPISSAFLTKIIDTFVDDTDLWDVLHGIPTTAAQAMTRMQIRAQTWERLMFSSGGKLNLGKCFWYFIAWKWTDGILSIRTINDYPGELQILSGSNPTPVTIDRIEASSALETLGLFTSRTCGTISIPLTVHPSAPPLSYHSNANTIPTS
jgi:hypothetical protein